MARAIPAFISRWLESEASESANYALFLAQLCDFLEVSQKRHLNTGVRFMTDLAKATNTCDAIFIAVGTPQSETGNADLSYIEPSPARSPATSPPIR